ncbi:hypothetical protein F4802DRAFT_598384 [Xylaria palmicola]|nr:hypothetical protein F4802DRAFT_598384 [Xylaria palmicola]
MLSRSVGRTRLFAAPCAATRTVRVPAILSCNYAEAHFPDSKVESLQQSQIWKVSEAIREDHKQLKDYYNQVVNSKDPDEQERYRNAFIWELARHSIAEEIVVYPAFEKNIPDGGREMADKDRAQHQTVRISDPGALRTPSFPASVLTCPFFTVQVKEQLYEFQKLKPKDEAYVPKLKSLFANLSQHIKEEEEEDLVKLEKILSLTESKELSHSFEKTKMLTPTRSHPSAPNKPPFETVAGLMTAPIDKLRDLLFTKFPEKKMPDIGHTEHGVGKSDR